MEMPDIKTVTLEHVKATKLYSCPECHGYFPAFMYHSEDICLSKSQELELFQVITDHLVDVPVNENGALKFLGKLALTPLKPSSAVTAAAAAPVVVPSEGDAKAAPDVQSVCSCGSGPRTKEHVKMHECMNQQLYLECQTALAKVGLEWGRLYAAPAVTLSKKAKVHFGPSCYSTVHLSEADWLEVFPKPVQVSLSSDSDWSIKGLDGWCMWRFCQKILSNPVYQNVFINDNDATSAHVLTKTGKWTSIKFSEMWKVFAKAMVTAVFKPTRRRLRDFCDAHREKLAEALVEALPDIRGLLTLEHRLLSLDKLPWKFRRPKSFEKHERDAVVLQDAAEWQLMQEAAAKSQRRRR